MTMNNLNWTGFYKKNIAQRLEMIQQNQLLQPKQYQCLAGDELLPLETADHMTENVLGRFALPFSVAPDFLVNHKSYHVPFVTEEPSVVAAASFAAKVIKRSGGFQTQVINRQMIGQVALYHINDFEHATTAIQLATDHLLAVANASYPSIVKRGGGARTLRLEQKEEFLMVYVTVDTQEAMGANMVNTMMEALVPELEALSGGNSLMAILSNYATESLVQARCSVDLRFLSRNKAEALQLAQKMAMASQLAQIDPYRAATHNKGIFNGIDAVAMATGNDWRAIEAGAHAYAAKDGTYKGLSKWVFDSENEVLIGEMTLPMPIASKGGSIGLNPTVQVAHDLLGNPNAKELSQLILAVGLAQNFAAIKALTSSGIQAGHMKLHAKSLALLAGASQDEVSGLVKNLLADKPMNLEKARHHLEKLRSTKKSD
ncbi:hydroxymethylglutaryl-CoA reductase, degradative [Streptococcus phocae subsp. phocae]|uniref:3-hydroxy-3-methylglutaryl coenzyme A reductase n=1 Tax=Streptococcus phocae TaxID=119224 RepID=A0A0P6S475_9STRE|nr:hydroxymethylglutaryl-CoA reductase, degradative [Streptococcus phocae]KPJ22933.1 3-hydroxy-3-methylglutaryl-CoA reductase [Streptococcus phocae]